MRAPEIFLFLSLICVAPVPALSALHEVREVHYQMGTFVELTLWHSDPDVARRLLRSAVQEVHRLEEILSNFDPDSSVSRFNRQSGKGKMNIPPELFELLGIAQRFSAHTSGDFDVTVGPLVDLWREALSQGLLPDRDAVARAQRQVGFEKLKLYGGGEAELLLPGMKIDFGGIGKGYAVDRVVQRFIAAGIGSALINFGGSSIFGVGAPPGEPSWEVGLQGTDGALRGVIHLRDMALSTSGSMGKFWTIDGKRYGHLIDPKSGIPVSDSRMATVITFSATVAEALTKPLVLRGEKALPVATRFGGTEAVVISAEGPPLFSRGFRSKARWQEIPSS